jgi:hypothetical protein
MTYCGRAFAVLMMGCVVRGSERFDGGVVGGSETFDDGESGTEVGMTNTEWWRDVRLMW